ncbi:hypothetical protein ACOMHN_013708 [Nucella lapillus]
MAVPPQGQERLLKDLRELHSGTSRLKALAWSYSYVWWPNMDNEIETTVCRCQKNGIKHIKSAPYHAEHKRTVQTLKQGLRKVTAGSMETGVGCPLRSCSSTERSGHVWI